jgi:site-specific recombinase XerD
MSARILPFPKKLAEPAGSLDATIAVATRLPPPEKLGALSGGSPSGDSPAESPPLTPRPLDRPPRELTPEETAAQDRMIQAYFEGVRPAKNHDQATIRRDRDFVREFLRFVGQPIWSCTPSDFEAWASGLSLERKLAAGTQRVMQGAVATFFNYLVDSVEWQNLAHMQFDARITKVATSTNRVIHTTDSASTRPRMHLTGTELTQVFAVLDSVIELAAIEAPRLFKCFQRDRAMFYVFYGFGLRLSEGHGLNISSFSPNVDAPEMGRCGFVGVYGKGSNGSGPKYRCVPCVHHDIPPVLEWYLGDVRPKFHPADPAAMWLSERGTRLCRSGIRNRFKRVLTACGLDASLFCVHRLRHLSISHQAEAGVPLAFTSKVSGHVHMSTTTEYTLLSDAFLRSVAEDILAGSLRDGGDA